MVLTHPAGHEGNERQPEQQVQVGPQDPAAHPMRRVEQVMVIAPVDPDVDEARDDDRDDAVAEGFEPILLHALSPRPGATASSGSSTSPRSRRSAALAASSARSPEGSGCAGDRARTSTDWR